MSALFSAIGAVLAIGGALFGLLASFAGSMSDNPGDDGSSMIGWSAVTFFIGMGLLILFKH